MFDSSYVQQDTYLLSYYVRRRMTFTHWVQMDYKCVQWILKTKNVEEKRQ